MIYKFAKLKLRARAPRERTWLPSVFAAGLLLGAGLVPGFAVAAEVTVAVAANFSAPMKVIARQFEQATGHRAVLSFGSSGKFYAQVQNGAPYEVFLSADQAKPEALLADDLAVAGSRFTYALGTLALWAPSHEATADKATQLPEVLKSGDFRRLAIANPRVAPYGIAALEVLAALGLGDKLDKSIVRGENIAQVYQFVSSGNADLGFVALSQLGGKAVSGSTWLVPAELHRPIRQDAVLLVKGASNPAAVALLEYLHSAAALEVIEQFGYSSQATFAAIEQ